MMSPRVGDLVRYRRLGSAATYRVCALDDDLVELEVIEGPGLRAGRRFKFTRDALGKMERVSLQEQNQSPTRLS
jgi:hypothetical protein